MRKQIALILIVLSVVITGFGMEVMGQGTKSDKGSLKGITTLSVVVEYIKPEFERDVVKVSTIQTDVELKLRMAGIKVIDMNDADKSYISEGLPYLYINFQIMNADLIIGKHLYVFHISVELKQDVRLCRNNKYSPCVTTWDTATIGFVGIGRTSEIRDSVKDQVDEFINYHL